MSEQPTIEQRVAALEEKTRQQEFAGVTSVGVINEIHQSVKEIEQKLNAQILLTTQVQTNVSNQSGLILGLRRDVDGQTVRMVTMQAELAEVKQDISGVNGKLDQVLALLKKPGE